MDLKLMEAKSMKSLEQYHVHLHLAILSLKTLEAYQKRVFELGILKDDQEVLTEIILFDLSKLITIYARQSESISEILPEEWSPTNIMNKIIEKELTAARKLLKKKKE